MRRGSGSQGSGPVLALACFAALAAVLVVTAVWASGDDDESAPTGAATTAAAGATTGAATTAAAGARTGAATTAAAGARTGAATPAAAGTTPGAATTEAAATATDPLAAGAAMPVADVTTAAPTAPPTTPAPLALYDGWVDPQSVGRPWGTTVAGMLTFRGNPTRSFFGVGPVPRTEPQVLWRFPAAGGLCSESSSRGETKTWCGTGWTGQANLWERADGSTWLLFGSYDSAFHFLDADNGQRTLPDVETGDINKGSATLDADGFPLYYAGSRDNQLRIIALDRPAPEVLWSLGHDDLAAPVWNSDWDGAPLVVGDYLFEGGENSYFHVVKLNRNYGTDGLVTVDPEVVFHAPGFDDELLSAIGDREVSIESSVTITGNVVYFANSGGLVSGYDISGLAAGRDPERVFRYWMGDDVDATIATDAEGYLYVGAEVQRYTGRTRDVGGTFAKLDPRRPDDPLVWVWRGGTDDGAGIWSTAAIVGPAVILSTNDGRVVGLDRATGAQQWQVTIGTQAWTSPVVVDGVMIVGDCEGGLHAFSLPDPLTAPTPLWTKRFTGCLEATPTVWKGRIYLGSRDGGFYALG